MTSLSRKKKTLAVSLIYLLALLAMFSTSDSLSNIKASHFVDWYAPDLETLQPYFDQQAKWLEEVKNARREGLELPPAPEKPETPPTLLDRTFGGWASRILLLSVCAVPMLLLSGLCITTRSTWFFALQVLLAAGFLLHAGVLSFGAAAAHWSSTIGWVYLPQLQLMITVVGLVLAAIAAGLGTLVKRLRNREAA